MRRNDITEHSKSGAKLFLTERVTEFEAEVEVEVPHVL